MTDAERVTKSTTAPSRIAQVSSCNKEIDRFLVGGTARCVAVLVIAHREKDYKDEFLNLFYARLVKMAHTYGTSLPDRFQYFHKTSKPAVIKRIFRDWQLGKYPCPDLVISVLPSGIGSELKGEPPVNSRQIHGLVELLELLTGIPTQHFKMWTIKSYPYFEYLCAINLKLGGINWDIAITDEDPSSRWLGKPGVLICGISAKYEHHGTGETKLMVVGMAANTGQSMFDYTGQHWFIPPTPENKVLEEEVVLLRKGLQDAAVMLDPQIATTIYGPKLSVVITKPKMLDHDTQNVDEQESDGPVNSLQQYIIQVTDSNVEYSVVLDENKITQDELKALCQNLRYGDQSCVRNKTFPVPITYARKMVKNAMVLLCSYRDNFGLAADSPLDCRQLSEKLSIEVRINKDLASFCLQHLYSGQEDHTDDTKNSAAATQLGDDTSTNLV